MQRNREKIEWKEQRSLPENQKYQGNVSCKDGTIKDRKGMDLTEAELLRRGGKNTQNYTKRSS